MSSNHSENQGTKKVEYDYVPTLALSFVVIFLVLTTIVSVAFIWNVLNNYSSKLSREAQGKRQIVFTDSKGQAVNVATFRENELKSQQTMPQAMAYLLKNPGIVSTLPKSVPAFRAPAPRRVVPAKRTAPVRRAPRRAAPARPAPVRRAAPAPARPAPRAAAPKKAAAPAPARSAAPTPARVPARAATPAPRKAPAPARKAAPAKAAAPGGPKPAPAKPIKRQAPAPAKR